MKTLTAILKGLYTRQKLPIIACWLLFVVAPWFLDEPLHPVGWVFFFVIHALCIGYEWARYHESKPPKIK